MSKHNLKAIVEYEINPNISLKYSTYSINTNIYAEFR